MKTLSHSLGRKLAAFAATITLFGLSALAPAHGSLITYDPVARIRAADTAVCPFPTVCAIAPLTIGTPGFTGMLKSIIVEQQFAATMFTDDGFGGPGDWKFGLDFGLAAAHLVSVPVGAMLVGNTLIFNRPHDRYDRFMRMDQYSLLFDASTPRFLDFISFTPSISGMFSAANTFALDIGVHFTVDESPTPTSRIPEPDSMALAGLALVAVVLSQRRKSPA